MVWPAHAVSAANIGSNRLGHRLVDEGRERTDEHSDACGQRNTFRLRDYDEGFF